MCTCEFVKDSGLGSGWLRFHQIWTTGSVPSKLRKIKPQVDLPGKGGVYAIKIYADGNEPDECSVIQIGKTKDISVRLGTFLSGALGFGAYHAEGNTFAKTMVPDITAANLAFSFRIVEGEEIREKLKDAECELFHRYVVAHGKRYPKLNKIVPPGYYERHGKKFLQKAG